MSNQDMIDEIMDWFDFKKVRKAMKALNWTWANLGHEGPPTVKELKESARGHLKLAATLKEGDSCGSGGFEATKLDKGLRLCFMISDWEAWGEGA